MEIDVDDLMNRLDLKPPAPSGSKGAWVAFASELVLANQSLQQLIVKQAETIRDLQDAWARSLEDVGKYQSTGIRQRLPTEKVEGIRSAIARGASTRQVASQFGVSPMTVSRIGRRMKAKAAEIGLAPG